MADVPVFMISRIFEAPIEEVFDAWADQEKMAAWSGPPGAKLTPLSGDIEEGSLMHTRSDHPEMGTTYTLALWREGDKIRPSFFPHWPLTLLTEVDFESIDSGTRITLTWTPIEATPEDIAEFERQMGSMKMGWGGSLDKLAEMLAAS